MVTQDFDKSGKKTAERKPVIGITLGDLNGVGPEVVIKALGIAGSAPP
jgi:hypothetical protein